MGIYRKVFLYLKYRKKKFKFLGKDVDYKQKNSKFLSSDNISIGNYSKVLDYAYLEGIGGITIGDCTVIAPKCTILTVNHNYNDETIDMLPFNNLNIMKEVIIGNYCWVGRDVMILPGVKIGEGSIVAGGSVVVKDVEPYSIVGGNPAKIIKYRNKEKIQNLIKNKKCWNNKEININNQKKYLRETNEE
jgi:acetyltransferase-like isoleucine patch superfamily enzyme